MGRDAVKSAGNVWRDARLEAAKYNEELSSQEKVAALLGFGTDAIRRIETDTNKVMPVDSAVLLADLYHAPELLNYYCLHECPIGRNRSISSEVLDIDRVTVKFFKQFKFDVLEKYKNMLLDIADDGEITKDEIPNLIEINEYLKELSKTISEIETLTERTIREIG